MSGSLQSYALGWGAATVCGPVSTARVMHGSCRRPGITLRWNRIRRPPAPWWQARPSPARPGWQSVRTPAARFSYPGKLPPAPHPRSTTGREARLGNQDQWWQGRWGASAPSGAPALNGAVSGTPDRAGAPSQARWTQPGAPRAPVQNPARRRLRRSRPSRKSPAPGAGDQDWKGGAKSLQPRTHASTMSDSTRSRSKASATPGYVTCPFTTFKPSASAGSCLQACCQPSFAIRAA